MQRVQDDYLQAEIFAEVTEESLEELRLSPPTDLKKAYGVFLKRAQTMEEAGKRLVVHADEMHYSGASYLVESGTSPTACVFPRLQKTEELRADNYGSYFDSISDEAWKVKRAFRAFQFDVQQIRGYLSGNLTPISVDNINPMMDKARVDAKSLHFALEDVLAAIDLAKSAKAESTANSSLTP